mmetsp:Transcript_3310/g.7998  ORF Transcript_3310/g.7998 Transcript_3310/m.7998 type:complete len:384 (+) Transcript_3310:79-1230(+)
MAADPTQPGRRTVSCPNKSESAVAEIVNGVEIPQKRRSKHHKVPIPGVHLNRRHGHRAAAADRNPIRLAQVLVPIQSHHHGPPRENQRLLLALVVSHHQLHRREIAEPLALVASRPFASVRASGGVGTLPDGDHRFCLLVDAAGDADGRGPRVRDSLGKAKRPVGNPKIIHSNLPHSVAVGGHPDHLLVLHVLRLHRAKHQGARYPHILGEVDAEDVALQRALQQDALQRGRKSRLPEEFREIQPQDSIKRHVLKHILVVAWRRAFENARPDMLVVNRNTRQTHLLEHQPQLHSAAAVLQVPCALILRDPHSLRRGLHRGGGDCARQRAAVLAGGQAVPARGLRGAGVRGAAVLREGDGPVRDGGRGVPGRAHAGCAAELRAE